MADPIPMDTSAAPDAPEMAGVIDATDPPTAADHAAPPPSDAAGDDSGAAADPPAASDSAMAMDTSSDLPPASAVGRPVTPQEEEEARQAIDLLRGDDVAGRVEAANKLESVAAALGVERTRDVSFAMVVICLFCLHAAYALEFELVQHCSPATHLISNPPKSTHQELLPFLTDGMDDEDEVLAAIATNLRHLLPHVGGPTHATHLLPPLELLLTVEETSVRNEACDTGKIIADALPESIYRTEYAAMVSRLAGKEWFTARMSAANLIAAGYERLGMGGGDGGGGGGGNSSEQCAEHMAHFAALCRDDAPMVRRVASQNLGTVAEAAIKVGGKATVDGAGDGSEDSLVVGTLLPLYEELAANTQPVSSST